MRFLGIHLPSPWEGDNENEQLQRRLAQLEADHTEGLQTLRSVQDEHYSLQAELVSAQRKLAGLQEACADAEAKLETLKARK